ncbi:LysR substrate-binding domain-containing protein [Williamsia sp. 1135]|uniref:LysR family transcriptional regulator n=1 Tax=Williamsia sp. 1135 TaxID=1889262 RepID=UPI000A0FEBF4|nr:LysR substrate-binding domain-containing protein [Williamsia sp. 1135]ORM31839.1 LysR family transcriptional regulator [Williamsia sp. 1135]
MELRQLEYFVAVAEEANFTRAAERVRISQSGVSAQVRQLERELGCELFDRSSRVARLTSAGRAALGPARAALEAAAGLGHAVDEVGGLLRGELSIGMVIGCTITPLFVGLEKFHRRHPGVALSLHEDNSDRMVDDLHAGKLDIALIGAYGSAPAGLDSMTIVSEALCVLVPPGHEWAARKSVRVADLDGSAVICMPQGTGIRATLDDACAGARVSPVIALQATSADAIADLASRGLGAAVLSESMSADFAERLVALPLDGVPEPALLLLVWSSSSNPALRVLISCLTDAFGV